MRGIHSRRRAGLAAAAATMLVGAGITAASRAGADVPDPADGFTAVWSDDFAGAANSLPSTSNWIFDLGTRYPGGAPNWGTGETQTYTKDTRNVSLDGSGNLRITPIKDGSGAWTSARLETVRKDFRPPAGGVLRIEGRIQMPNVTGAEAAGYWPAFWALGSPFRGVFTNWPRVGEFDVMENVNGEYRVHGVLCNEFNGLGGNRACPDTACQAGFHTYRFEWDASGPTEELRWSVDGQLYHTVKESDIAADAWSAMTDHEGYFLLLNVAMGGAFPNGVAGSATPTAATVSGRPMIVDYVAVSAKG
jgi:beta-glucanase (GH16 family)